MADALAALKKLRAESENRPGTDIRAESSRRSRELESKMNVRGTTRSTSHVNAQKNANAADSSASHSNTHMPNENEMCNLYNGLNEEMKATMLDFLRYIHQQPQFLAVTSRHPM